MDGKLHITYSRHAEDKLASFDAMDVHRAKYIAYHRVEKARRDPGSDGMPDSIDSMSRCHVSNNYAVDVTLVVERLDAQGIRWQVNEVHVSDRYPGMRALNLP